MPKDANKPRGKTTAYAFFVQQCREELKKKSPNETVVFSEFSRKCAEKWKAMKTNDKKRFEDMASKDKVRYDKEMANYTPSEATGRGKGKKGKRAPKDPNAPKRALSAFFCFCNEERSKVKAKNPNMTVGDIAKELGKRWETCANKTKYEELAAKDKVRYEKEMAAYKKGGAAPAAARKAPAGRKPMAKKKQEESEDEEDEESEEEDDEDDDE
jgi:hypothetical protein